jgi:flagellar biosynthesis protein FlhA
VAIVPANAQARAKDALKIGQGLLVRGEMWLALGVIAILVMLILPMPTWLLDFMLGVSIASSVLILMVTLFIQRPTDLSSFPTILLMTTLLRLALNMASTRLILSNGHQGTAAAGHVIETFGNLLMSGNFIIGVIVFIILLIVNFVVITKGSGRIAEVAARFTLDAMPGKQMAIDADLSSGLINEAEAKARRKQLEDESTFYGAMDGAAKFVRGDAVAGLLITMINIIGGLLIGTLQHNLSFLQAANNYTLLTVGDGLVSQIPALIVSVAAGLLVTKGNAQGTTDKALVAQLGGFPAAMGMAAVLVAVLSFLPGMPTVGFLMISAVMGAAAFYASRGQQTAIVEAAEAAASGLPPGVAPGTPGAAIPVADEPISTALQIDQIRLELGYGLLALINSPKGARLTDQIKALRRQVASEMGYIMPAVRIQDNLQLPANTYVVRIKEMEAGRGELRPNMLLVMDPRGEPISLVGEATTEPTFGLPAMWIAESNREEALFRGYTVVDPPTVITTHLTEVVKDNMPDLLSYAETQKLLNEIDKESQKLVADVIPGQVTVNGLQRILQNLLAERVSIRDLPTILEAVAEASAFTRNVSMMTEHVRTRLARQISEAHSVSGVLPLVTLSPEWEQAFAEALVGQGEEKQLSMQPSQLQRFISSVRQTFDRFAVMGESPVLLVSPAIRPYVRSIIERFRPATTILSQSEIHPKAKIRTLGQI